MIQDSLSVPVRAHEASQLADLIFQFAEGRTVDDALRRMLASRATQTPFEAMQVYWGRWRRIRSRSPRILWPSTERVQYSFTSPCLPRLAAGCFRTRF